MVKKFIRNPATIKRAPDITQSMKVKGVQGRTPTTLVRLNNRKVPLNPQASQNAPRAGTFATRQRGQNKMRGSRIG